MTSIRKKRVAAFDVQVAIREGCTIAELSSEYRVHVSQIHAWKRAVRDGVNGLFDADKKTARTGAAGEWRISGLHEKVGQIIMECDFFRERSGLMRDTNGVSPEIHCHSADSCIALDRIEADQLS